jgi:hypothetical protein
MEREGGGRGWWRPRSFFHPSLTKTKPKKNKNPKQIHYLHSDTFGNQSKPEIRGMRVETDAYGVTARFALHNKAVSPLWAWSVVPEVHVTARCVFVFSFFLSFLFLFSLPLFV